MKLLPVFSKGATYLGVASGGDGDGVDVSTTAVAVGGALLVTGFSSSIGLVNTYSRMALPSQRH